jgi:hypothetical protein
MAVHEQCTYVTHVVSAMNEQISCVEISGVSLRTTHS